MKNTEQQFNHLGSSYAQFVSRDPIRNSLHYPAVIKCLGGMQGGRVLDIGCGDGALDRLLVEENNVRVVGFDIAPDLIEIASEREKFTPLGIVYSVSDPEHFHASGDFDSAVAVMVLPYALDVLNLRSFFVCAFNNVKAGGEFWSVVFNPNFIYFNEVIANRKFVRLANNFVQVYFLDPESGTVVFTSELIQYSKIDYEDSARAAGFATFSWHGLEPDFMGMEKYGNRFWQKCIKIQPYALFVCKK